MYGVMKKCSRKGCDKEIILCETLEKAERLREDMAGHNEFYSMEEKLYGGYKIVRVEIEEIS